MQPDFKIVIDNQTNQAASMMKNIPERHNEPRFDLLQYKVEKHLTRDVGSGVYERSNTVWNTTDRPFRLSHFSSAFFGGVAPDFHRKEVLIHFCHFAWQGEAQWRAFSPYDLGLYPVAKHSFSHMDKTVSSTGSWSTHKYYPIVIVEDKTDGKIWYFEMETGGSWSFEFGTFTDNGVCSLTLDCCACSENNNGFFKTLSPGESFETPKVLYGITDSFENAIRSLLRYKRAVSRKPEKTPVCFNDYMNCLWALPSREKLIPLIDAAASVGAEIFCIDDGWYIRDGEKTDFGDWIENDSLFGEGGLRSVITYIKSRGMIPGIWMELETAFIYSAVSSAPDAILTRGGVPIGEERRFLNFASRAVTDYLYGRVRHLYEMGVRYLKNDYNHSTGIGCDGEGSFAAALLENHSRFLAFIDRLIADMPDLMIENCASGAMRCDHATLQHFHLQSISDQEIFTNMPSIIRGMQGCIPPEKTGIWSYPYPAEFAFRENYEEAYSPTYTEKMEDGGQTVYNMACAFFGIMSLSGHIEKCDSYNLFLIRKAIEAYKADRDFLLTAMPVWIGEQQKLYTEGYSVLALQNERKIRIGVFKNGGEESVSFAIPEEFGGSVTEVYSCREHENRVSLTGNIMRFSSAKKVTAGIYEIAARQRDEREKTNGGTV